MEWNLALEDHRNRLQASMVEMLEGNGGPLEVLEGELALAEAELALQDFPATEAHIRQARESATDLSLSLTDYARLAFCQAPVHRSRQETPETLHQMHEAVLLAEQAPDDPQVCIYAFMYLQDLLLAGQLDTARLWLRKQLIPPAWANALCGLILAIEQQWWAVDALLPRLCDEITGAPTDVQAVVFVVCTESILAGGDPRAALGPAQIALQFARDAGSALIHRAEANLVRCMQAL